MYVPLDQVVIVGPTSTAVTYSPALPRAGEQITVTIDGTNFVSSAMSAWFLDDGETDCDAGARASPAPPIPPTTRTRRRARS